MFKTLLIVPCYNEEKRLQLGSFAAHLNENLHFVFVDDGSQDGTWQLIEGFCKKQAGLFAIRCPQNLGKGEAIRFASNELQRRSVLENYDWIGFWDADLATPLHEISKMFQFLNLYSPDCQAVWGSRVYRLGSKIVRSPLRHYLGRGFATLISVALGVESYDSQCGAKLFKKESWRKTFSEPFISRWIFDVEILLRLEQKGVIEYPLTNWQDVPGSTLKIGKEIFRVFRDILRIRKKYITPAH